MKTGSERLTKGLASGSLSGDGYRCLLAVSAVAPPFYPRPLRLKHQNRCPECKMVPVTNPYRWGRSSRHQVYVDQCPGCQGAIVTLLKEGKLQHKCSICKEKPFNCPVFHPAA